VTSLSFSAWNEVSVKLSRLQHLQIYNSQVQCCLKVELHDTATCATMLEPLADQVTQTEAQLLVLTMIRHSGALRCCCQSSFVFAVAQDISCCRASNYLNADYWWP